MKNKILNKLTDLLFYLCILIFTIGLNFQDTPPPNGWYQQWMPDLNGRQITDITFLDSLIGYAVTNSLAPGDTGYILKTTNGGDNWSFSFIINRGLTAIGFVNTNTGYACGGSGGGTTYLTKTTNAGLNWFLVNSPSAEKWDDMYVLNEDTLWLVEDEGMTGGVFRTTNGGVSWQQQLALGSQNPTHIYFYNGDIGFISKNTGSYYTRKTTDGGASWSVIINEGFTDIYFIDSLEGWKCFGLDSIKKTTDGGINWIKLLLPPTSQNFGESTIRKFSFVNKDTIWGVGAVKYNTPVGSRGLIYISTNGGQTWGYQLPDVYSINIWKYYHIKFVNKNIGWAYSTSSGVHTVTGGDTTIYLGVHQISSEVPKGYNLHQNYPNPFNSKTIISYELNNKSNVRLDVFDMQGREMMILVKQEQEAGTYQVDFPGKFFSSGVYLYRLLTDGNLIGTKKMLLIK